MTDNNSSTPCTSCNKSDGSMRRGRCKSAHCCSKACQAEHWPSHKADCKPNLNYLLRFQVFPGQITNLPVWRTLSVPASTTFAKLHGALQITFGWAGTHSYEFIVNDPDFDPDQEDLQAYIQSRARMDAAGPDWRGDADAQREYILRVIDDSSNRGPHRKIDRMHLPQRVHPRTPTKKASQTKLFEVFGKAQYKDNPFQYVYDLGDNWEHDFAIVGTAPPTDKIACLDGLGHPIAEDVGSYPGWLELLDAYRAARPNQERREKMTWFTRTAANADIQGLSNGRDQLWDREGVARKLQALT